MAQFRKIGVLTSGGDAPGMNAAIRAVTLSAYAHGVEVIGIMKGYTGLISGELKELTPRDVANISGLSGTILYSDRCPEFKTEEGMAKAIKTCRDNHIDGIVAIGGDGTFRGATDLSIRGIPTIGLPGTIDNDITSSDYTIGFDTAMNTVVTCADNLRDTGESHARCMVMEVMGNGAGDIALNCGLAVGAVAIAIKELPFDEDAAIATIKAQRAKGQRSFIVMISESMGGEFGEALTKRIMAETGVDSRFVRLGHIVRGGAPSSATGSPLQGWVITRSNSYSRVCPTSSSSSRRASSSRSRSSTRSCSTVCTRTNSRTAISTSSPRSRSRPRRSSATTSASSSTV